MKKLTYIFAATMFMVACNNEGLISTQDGENAIIKFNSNLNAYSSQVVSRLGETSFDQNDEVALWANVSEGEVPFTGREILTANTDGSLYSSNVLEYKDDNTVFFSALYPASLCTEDSKPSEITLDVKSDDNGYQSLPDLIYATATGSTASPTVNFIFKRQLAKVCVAVKNEGVDLSNAEVFVRAKSGGIFNLQSLSVTLPDNAQIEDYKIPLTIVENFYGNQNYGSTIVAPQTLEGACIGIKLNDGTETKYVSLPSIVLDSAKKYIFNITTRKKGDVEISLATGINELPWISDDATEGEVEVDEIPSAEPGDNLITNSDFETGISSWNGWGGSLVKEQSAYGEGYNGTGYSFKITNPTASANDYNVQIAWDFSTPLIQGGTYRLTMNIKGSVEGTIGAAIQKIEGFAGAGYFNNINVTTEWTSYTGDVVINGNGADHADRLLFNIGKYAGTIYIDNVTFCNIETPQQ